MSLYLNFIAGMLALLTFVMLVAAVLILTRDEQANASERGLLMLGLAAFCGALVVFVFWLGHRSPSVPPTGAAGPLALPVATAWQKPGRGRPHRDWLALLLPFVLISLPVVLLRPGPVDLEGLAAAALLGAFVDLLVIPKLILNHLQYVRLRLDPLGLLVTRGSGASVLIQRGELRDVQLQTADMGLDSAEYGTLVLCPTTGKPVVFREPMSAPLPDIALACARHMGVPLSGTWGVDAGPAR